MPSTKQITTYLLAATTALSLALPALSMAADTSSKKIHWSYSGDDGPAHWGALSSAFEKCHTGQEQSPVDVKFSADKTAAIKTSYNTAPLNLVNNGHTIQQNFSNGGSLISSGKEYKLLQFHFHSPSEHRLEGKEFPLEMHLVHQAADGTLAVVGVFFKKGHKNSEIQHLWNEMPSSAHSKKSSHQEINVNHLVPENHNLVRYNGSLTTPPCSEGVKWHLYQTPLEISEAQIKKFKSIIHDNNRPLQPLNSRKLLVFKQ